MCGICGIFFPERFRRVDATALKRMNARIAHRGPDDEGFFLEENMGLAMRRLSIVDIKNGHQPLSNEDGDLWIVFNGEVYNHAELRRELEAKGHRYRSRTDTETIVHAYEEFGHDCVERLHGMFAFAIWDRRTRVLFAARDRLGIKPFYYRWDGQSFLFGSEIKAILAYPGVRAQFNIGTLAEYLAFGYISQAETMFAGIRKLMPGHTLEIDQRGNLRIERYWDLKFEVEDDGRPREYYVEGYREKLESSVRAHLMSDVPLGVFLSGGLDSSSVAALAKKTRGDQIKTFAVGYRGSPEEDAVSEFSAARKVAEHIRSDHHEVCLSKEAYFDHLPRLIWHEDEPLTWPSSVSLYSVAQLAREHVTVVLTGEGSDETLAGYTRYPWILLNSRMDAIYRSISTGSARQMVAGLLAAAPLGISGRRKLEHTFLCRNGDDWTSFYFDNFLVAFPSEDQAKLLAPDILRLAGKPYAASLSASDCSEGDLLHRLLYGDIKTYLVELLMKQDQMSMAASIESRVPFLDHELVEFALRIPARYSVSGLAGKYILKRAMADLLPQSIIHKKKMGFPTPWDSWLRGPELDRIEKMLLSPRSLNRNLFRRHAIQRIFNEHRNKIRDNGSRIWRLLNLEIWSRVFLEGEPLQGFRYE